MRRAKRRRQDRSEQEQASQRVSSSQTGGERRQRDAQAVSTSSGHMDELAIGRLRQTVGQFMQVPSNRTPAPAGPSSFNQFVQTSSSSSSSGAANNANKSHHYAAGRPAPIQFSGAGCPLASSLMEAARHHHHQQQQQHQSLLDQFASLHSLSAVAAAIQSQSAACCPHPADQYQPAARFAATAVTTPLEFLAPLKSEAAPAGPAGRPPGRRKRRGAPKCRKVYGMAQWPLWCTQCRWKKACTRFVRQQQQQSQQQPEVSTTTKPIRRTSHKWRAASQTAAGQQQVAPAAKGGQGGAASTPVSSLGNHLISNLLDMSASLGLAVSQASFKQQFQKQQAGG